MLTDTKIKAALKAVATEIVLTDKGEGRGAGSLFLTVRRLKDQSVTAQWFASVKRDGKRTKRAIGRYPDVSLSMARQTMRADVSPQLRSGKALRVVATAAERPTVGNLFEAYAASLEAKNSPSAPEVRRVLLVCKDNAADRLGRDTLAGDVTEADVAAYVSIPFRRGKRGAADKARAYVSAAFGYAMASTNDYTNESRQNWGVARNPVTSVKRDEKARKRINRALDVAEMRALWRATEPDAEGFSLEVASLIRLVLLCGQRVQETLRLEGREVDMAKALWSMPAEKTKVKEAPHHVPLPVAARQVIARLIAVHGDGPLFPARRGSKSALIQHQSVRQAITRWLEDDAAGIPHFTPRDLRRTWKSRAGDGPKISRENRDLIQQHDKNDTGSVFYDRADYLPQMREAMEQWAAWFTEQVINEPVSSDDAHMRNAE